MSWFTLQFPHIFWVWKLSRKFTFQITLWGIFEERSLVCAVRSDFKTTRISNFMIKKCSADVHFGIDGGLKCRCVRLCTAVDPFPPLVHNGSWITVVSDERAAVLRVRGRHRQRSLINAREKFYNFSYKKELIGAFFSEKTGRGFFARFFGVIRMKSVKFYPVDRYILARFREGTVVGLTRKYSPTGFTEPKWFLKMTKFVHKKFSLWMSLNHGKKNGTPNNAGALSAQYYYRRGGMQVKLSGKKTAMIQATKYWRSQQPSGARLWRGHYACASIMNVELPTSIGSIQTLLENAKNFASRTIFKLNKKQNFKNGFLNQKCQFLIVILCFIDAVC